MFDDQLIYVVDDDKNTRRSLQVGLQNKGLRVSIFDGPISVLKNIDTELPDLIVLDIRMGELSGLDLYQRLLKDGYSIPVVFMSGHASMSEAVEAVQLGAYDFLEKPFAIEKLLITIRRCFDLSSAKKELRRMQMGALEQGYVGQSKVFREVLGSVAKVAPTSSLVMISGESGTGKELIANEVHQRSRCSLGPFVKVNCAAIPESLFESELFGHEKGAFTGAERSKKGYFEQANGGTLFLDEIGEMSLASQAKILRVLQTFEVQRVGSDKVIPVQVRVVVATNRDLVAEVKKGNFREDLFYRINVYPIVSPALRERVSDIPLLAEHFVSQYVKDNGLPKKHISAKAVVKLQAYHWPGNIRELKNTVERMAILGGQTLEEHHLVGLQSDLAHNGENFTEEVNETLSLKKYKEKVERSYLIKILRGTTGNISEAASILEIERTYLHKKIQQLSIQKKEYFI